jgi:ubiquinone/menaquinone biosynthesis C-methylase UbiE
MSDPNRYRNDWDAYSRNWDTTQGDRHAWLGDEWSAEDAANAGKGDAFIFESFARPFLRPDDTVLELGPGGGKWTAMLAPHVKKVIALDVSPEMLKRTRERCEAAGLSNVEYVLGNGRNFKPVRDESVHFFFSYDVLVHVALEDTFAYAREIARVLTPGGYGACHHAVNTTPDSWVRVEHDSEWYRGGKNTMGQYYFHSPEGLRRMYEMCALPVMRTHQWWCMWIGIVQKSDGVTPQLERMLHRLTHEALNDPTKRAALLDDLRTLPGKLAKSIEPVIEQIAAQDDRNQRVWLTAQLRKLWRGF